MNKQIAIGGLGWAFAVVLAVGLTVALSVRQMDTGEFLAVTESGLPSAQVAPSPVLAAPEPAAKIQPSASHSVAPDIELELLVAPATVAHKRADAERVAPGASYSVAPTSAVEPSAYPEREYRNRFQHTEQNPVRVTRNDPVSTFSVDVDTASYAYIRSELNHGILPAKDAVRVEEMINYFNYEYPAPDNRAQPFHPAVWVHPAPWNDANKLLHIGIRGYDLARQEAPAANLVFLLDVSGSMDEPSKLPLVVNSMKLLLQSLKPTDSIAIVVYAGAAGTVLEPTPVRERGKILRALDNLESGGSTAGAEGIRLAYQLAESRFDADAVNRVILATDGDFNVGMTGIEELTGFIERKRASGVFLSVLGFGRGNLNDHLMQQLAQNGNGVAAYIDTLIEARKVLVEEASSSLFPIAKDVKIQVEFNPERVAEYRLIGYETRALEREDFNNDAVDAGDIGAGHSVTAIYEITPPGGDARLIDDTRYQQNNTATPDEDGEFADEYALLKIRYKLPDEDTSRLMTTAITTNNEPPLIATALGVHCPPGGSLSLWHWRCLDRDANWAAAVAGFAQLLKGGKYTGDYNYDDVIELASRNKDTDPFGYRAEFIQLVRLAKSAAAMEGR